jgi:hypothetical protein
VFRRFDLNEVNRDAIEPRSAAGKGAGSFRRAGKIE